LVLLAMPDASGFVPGRWERFFPVVRHSACKATSQSAEFGFEIGPVLQEAHKAWGRLFEDHEEPAKLREEIGKQWEEIRKLREDLQLLGIIGVQQTQAFWVQQLCQDGAGGLELTGNSFSIYPVPQNIADLKKAINPSLPPIEASKIDIYLQQEDGKWKKVEKMGASLQDTDEENPYGYTLP